MLTFFLDRTSSTPLYEQLYLRIKQGIENNTLKKDDSLPSKRRLADHLEISLTTVESAYMQLETEGYIKSVPRVGFFVATDLDLPNKPIKDSDEKVTISEERRREWRIDFLTDRIDPVVFPQKTYAKIARDAILDDYAYHLDRGHPQGSVEFRKKVAELLYAYRGFSTSYKNIVIGSGSEQLLSFLTLLLGRNATVAIENPCYPKNYHLYKSYGIQTIPVGLDQEGVDVSALKSTNASIIHTTPSHQYPTGIVTTINKRSELLHWASRKDNRFIIEDDYDSEFRFYGTPIPAMKGLDDLGNVIYMNSFSKMLSPGFRVAYMVLPDRLLEDANHLFSFYGSGVPAFQQLVLTKFIESGAFEKNHRKMKKNYRHKRDHLINTLRHAAFRDKIEILGEEAGLHFLMRFDTHINEKTLITAAKEKGIGIMGLHECLIEPSDRWSMEKNIIFGYARPNENDIETGVRLLEKAWRDINLF